MNYINLSLFTIIGISLLSIFFSFWITENTDNDASAINLSGSMRMQTFHIGLAFHDAPKSAPALIAKLDGTWNSFLFRGIHSSEEDNPLTRTFSAGYSHWFNIVRPKLLGAIESEQFSTAELYSLFTKQVALTDSLVDKLQGVAEEKLRNLRTLQLLSLALTTIVGSLIFYLLKNRVEMPLKNLTEAAKKMGQGEIQQHLPEGGNDELSQLAKAFNQMSAYITKTYSELETLVDARTKELQHNNTMLAFLFGIARKVMETKNQTLDYNAVSTELANILGNSELELCLFTSGGDRPYLQVGADELFKACGKTSCANCKGCAPFDAPEVLEISHKYPITHHDKQYGVISIKTAHQEPLKPWQDQLLRSTTDQIAISLSLSETKDQDHRIAMLNERTVIARELHDSLAQALSYLQIQVTRLQKTHSVGKYESQQPIIDELREGLSSAYRNLRELLTTFRLKIDDKGLKGALDETLKQFSSRTDMDLSLDYSLKNLPLSPMEEIHLLQIIREAGQNAINHSEGETLSISLKQNLDKSITLTVQDDGKGLPESPEKLNHYGLAIMQERSRHLKGVLKIENQSQSQSQNRNKKQGLAIFLTFTPSYVDSPGIETPDIKSSDVIRSA